MAMGKTRRSFVCALASLLCACAIAGFQLTPALACSHDQGQYWQLSNGVLTIDLQGEMQSFDPDQGNRPPWYAKRCLIREVVLGEGVTSIGDAAFAGCSHLQTVTLPEDLTSIGSHAFDGCKSMTSLIYSGADAVANDDEAAIFSASVSHVGEDAFYGCKHIKDVYFQASDLADYVFDGASAEKAESRYDFAGPCATTIHVPATTPADVTREVSPALYAWAQQDPQASHVVNDIPVEGFYRVILPKSVQNGSIRASKAAAGEHEVVFLTPESAEGFHVASVRAHCEENGTVIELPVPKQQFLGYSIDMPAADVTVEVEFAEGVVPSSDPNDKSGSFKKADVEQVIANYPGARESFEEFYRTDLGSEKPYASENIKNRIFAKGWYTLEPIAAKYGADPTYQPSTEGMDTIFASGSRSFFEDEFRGLVAELRVAAQGKKIVIVDLRDESHAFLNGIGVSWFGYLNWGNYGKTMDEIVADEHERFGALVGKHVRTYAMSGDTKSAKSYKDIDVESVKYEDELVAEEGCDYLRIAGPDHSWPAPEKVDELISYLKTQDRNNIWLHFHCSGGVGRTGAFLVMYDKLQNPQVPMKDIVYRQAMTGSNFFYQEPEEGSYKVPFVLEKIRQCGLFAEYVEQNAADDYPITYTDWLKQRGEY